MRTLLVLQRLWQIANVVKDDPHKVENATIGYMTFYKELLGKLMPAGGCYTIENGGSSSAEANKDHRILPGYYILKFNSTSVKLPNEYKGNGLLLTNPTDPLFAKRRIFIHAGNYPQDTQGCILLQSTYDTTEDKGSGRGSMRAVKKMYDFVTKYATNENPMQLVIRDEFSAVPSNII